MVKISFQVVCPPCRVECDRYNTFIFKIIYTPRNMCFHAYPFILKAFFYRFTTNVYNASKFCTLSQ